VLAEIDPEGFYIFSFPGSMEVSALFRPYTKIEDGLVTAFQGPTNTFFYDEPNNLILFLGKEPNFKWPAYGECILSLASRFGVSTICFIGSVAGLVPHTRQPRLFGSVSEAGLKPKLGRLGIRFSNYEGPAGISTYLTRQCAERGIPMATLVAEIPAYVQGRNHRCIEAMTRQLAAMLDLRVNLDDLRALGDELEERLNKIVAEHPELLERIRKLEEDYDNEVFDTQMGDLKDWLQQQGIRLD
jgi:predicted ATP-grasp superfamily ATP-dependent carboligase